MAISIEIPEPNSILDRGVAVDLAPRGTTWSELPLGDIRKDKGVYVIHHNHRIRYVGRTSGYSMTFGIRMRRHFQESAAGHHTYPRLRELVRPPQIQVTMINLDEIIDYIDHGLGDHPKSSSLIRVFEAALICAFDPDFQNR